MCDVCQEIFKQEHAGRIYRVMQTYTHLVEAFEVFARQMHREIDLVSDFGETRFVNKDTIDATRSVLHQLGLLRDGFAQMASTTAGANRFKTGEIHRLYTQASTLLHDPDADRESVAAAVLALLPPD